MNAKNLEKMVFHFPTGGLTCCDGGYTSRPPLAPPLLKYSSILLASGPDLQVAKLK